MARGTWHLERLRAWLYRFGDDDIDDASTIYIGLQFVLRSTFVVEIKAECAVRRRRSPLTKTRD